MNIALRTAGEVQYYEMRTGSACTWLMPRNNTGYCISLNTAVHDQMNGCLAVAAVLDNCL